MNMDYIQKRRGEPDLFSFEYNLISKLISNLLPLHGQGISCRFQEVSSSMDGLSVDVEGQIGMQYMNDLNSH